MEECKRIKYFINSIVEGISISKRDNFHDISGSLLIFFLVQDIHGSNIWCRSSQKILKNVGVRVLTWWKDRLVTNYGGKYG